MLQLCVSICGQVLLSLINLVHYRHHIWSQLQNFLNLRRHFSIFMFRLPIFFPIIMPPYGWAQTFNREWEVHCTLKYLKIVISIASILIFKWLQLVSNKLIRELRKHALVLSLLWTYKMQLALSLFNLFFCLLGNDLILYLNNLIVHIDVPVHVL